MIQELIISDYRTDSNFYFKDLPLSFQIFGKALGSAPVVLVAHALTGNSSVTGSEGWWNSLIGNGRCIDLDKYTVLAFDIPGNGYNEFLLKDYKEVTLEDVARWFLIALKQLEIETVFAGIGGSLGGSVLWQMAVLSPDLFKNLIPIATHWEATDWILAQCRVQKQILEYSENPVHDARMHAMTFYRTPASFAKKFDRRRNISNGLFEVENWLLHHGKKLEDRFHLQSYKLMNHLLMTCNVEKENFKFSSLALTIRGAIYLIGIDTDGFYLNQEIKDTYAALRPKKTNVNYAEIKSIHGHDAFLIEYEQLSEILEPIFNPEKTITDNEIKYEHTTIG